MSAQGIRVDMVGQRAGRLTVHSFAQTRSGKAYWRCECECGNERVICGQYLRNGRTKSCGCLHKEMTANLRASHRMSGTPTYATWASMLSRCYNQNQECYAKYGALGVRVCDRWRKSFENFLADMGERPDGMTLDRKNPFGDYELSNCKWSTNEEQGQNKRGHIAIVILERLKTAGHGDLIDEAFAAVYTRPQ